jgi:hypothetical protein
MELPDGSMNLFASYRTIARAGRLLLSQDRVARASFLSVAILRNTSRAGLPTSAGVKIRHDTRLRADPRPRPDTHMLSKTRLTADWDEVAICTAPEMPTSAAMAADLHAVGNSHLTCPICAGKGTRADPSSHDDRSRLGSQILAPAEYSPKVAVGKSVT